MSEPESALQRGIDGYLIWGGTSKGFFADPAAFPEDPDKCDELVLKLFGSPDPLQVDGLGGSHTHTSKLMLVDKSEREDADLAYRYAQVGIDEATVDWDRELRQSRECRRRLRGFRGARRTFRADDDDPDPQREHRLPAQTGGPDYGRGA